MSYRNETYYYTELDGLMRLPNYQRPLVWSKDQKITFIDNISKGYPFGSLLLYKYEDGEKYTLIDGQQRYTTLQEYSQYPERFFPLEDSEQIDRLMDVSGTNEQCENSQESLRSKFISFAKELIKKKASGENPEASFLAEQVIAEFPSAKNHALDVANVQGDILAALDKYVDLKTLQVPCVIFTGDKSDLPDVFANVNLGGRKLTKYQVFAAQWDRYSMTLNDAELSNKILDKTINRYERLTLDRGGLVIEDFSPEEMRNNRKVSLPEFCHALGEMIIENSYACWPKKSVDTDDTVDTIGYNTLAIVFGIHPKELSTLPGRFEKTGLESDGLAVENLLVDVMREYKEINERFATYLKRPGTKEKYETSKTSGNLQFLSFFAALWRLHYNVNDNARYEVIPGYKHKGYEATCKNLFPSFVHDMLTNQWKGSGDTRLGNYISGALTYSIPVSADRLRAAMDSYLDELKDSESINVDPVTKTLLTIFASSHPGEYLESSYDYEHLIPRDTLNKKFNGKPAYREFRIPGGGIGNIANLDSSTNSAKGSKTLADAEGEMFSFNGEREDINKQSLREANFELLEGNPERAKAFMRDRARDISGRIVDHICCE